MTSEKMLLESSRIGGIFAMLCRDVRLLCEVEGRVTAAEEAGEVICCCGKIERFGEMGVGGERERGEFERCARGMGFVGERGGLSELSAGESDLVGEEGGGEGGGQGESLLGIPPGKVIRL